MDNIAWITETYEVNGITERRLIREGMSREDIIRNFPPARKNGLSYNRLGLVKAVIMEAYNEDVARPRGNVRSFWYERLFWTLIKVMGESGDEDNMNSIDVTISNAWKELVEDEDMTDLYEVLNIYSEKRRGYRISVKEDSPYPTAVVFVEKESLFGELADIADTFEISLCCAGGQNSREAALDYASRLEKMGVDPYQDFTVFSYTDLDPEGYAIPEGFITHLGLKVHGNIRLVRLGVLPNQLGESVIKLGAIPYSMDSKTEQARNGKRTKWDHFVAETGGVFIKQNGNKIPARVELNIYTPEQLRERIIQALSEQLKVLSYQTRELANAIRSEYFGATSDVINGIEEDVKDIYSPYYDAIDSERESIESERQERAPDERKRIAELEAEIESLRKIVDEACADLDKKDEALDKLHSRLETDEEETAKHITKEWEDEEYPDEDELIISITDWPEWMSEVGIDTIDDEFIANDAREHRDFSYRVPYTERESIREWIIDQIDGNVGSADELDETPEQMIARIYGLT